MSQELKARSNAKVAYLKTERLQQPVLVGSLFVCRATGLLAKLYLELWCQGFKETCFGFCVFA